MNSFPLFAIIFLSSILLNGVYSNAIQGKEIDIEKVYRLILEDQLKYGYFSVSNDNQTIISHLQRAVCEYTCPSGCIFFIKLVNSFEYRC